MLECRAARQQHIPHQCNFECNKSNLIRLRNKYCTHDFFGKNNDTIVVSISKIDITKCFYISKNAISLRDMRYVTL